MSMSRHLATAALTVLLAAAGTGAAQGVIGWDSAKPGAVAAGKPVIGWDSAPAGSTAVAGGGAGVIGWD
ncbi:hypothetical protein ACIQUQ_10460 [Streptomyces sp. NPDC101118]|uniref:hypothetical protein n=1 Tax=Streptomyces sp. NPDC101118 TaxID=3366109 RepID=UPI003811FC1F